LGVGREAYWQALEASQSGIDWFPATRGTELPFPFAGMLRDFDPKQYIQPRKSIKVMCREIQTAYACASLAVQDAGLPKEAAEPDRMGIVLGSELFYGELDELGDVYRHCHDNGQFRTERWADYAFKNLFPLWMLKYLPNMAASHISIVHDARGPNNSIVQGGASSLLAMMEAAAAIQRGSADIMLAGGSGSNAELTGIAFRGWEQHSQWPGQPEESSRPFDAQRCGIVVGEGAATFVLEERGHAERRGAQILARIAGFSSRYEGRGGWNVPRTGAGIRSSIAGALNAAGMSPGDIGHVNAHGDSSIHGDRAEAQAICETLGDVPVTAIKSYFGDLGAGSGAVELAASILGLVHGRIPPTRNYDQPDPECPVNVIRAEPLPVDKPVILKLNQSLTGQAVAMVVTGV
ncbi:MAG TPA: beta-ketoacyl-[acyl-carrier-protein] synthase family protein, partial [Pirellulaceae bacterium]|nr:beta-ketoacyl-[acyl-carrier-protein] synthase family protein [Pirellulaceae bacterium]